MGTFAGHLLPGSMFLFISIWSVNSVFSHFFRNYNLLRRTCITNGDPRLKFDQSYSKLAHGLFMTAAASIGFIGEYLTAFDKGPVMCKDNLQHMGMYSAFFVLGMSHFLIYFNSPLPGDTHRVLWIFAFFSEALLFYFHLHGRSMLDVQVHTLQMIAAIWCLICSALEWKYDSSILAATGRPFWMFLQGTWMIQVGFILYNPIPGHKEWNAHDHGQAMVVAAMFCWHISGAVVFFTFIYFRSYCRHRNIVDAGIGKFTPFRTEYTDCDYKPLNVDDHGGDV